MPFENICVLYKLYAKLKLCYSFIAIQIQQIEKKLNKITNKTKTFGHLHNNLKANIGKHYVFDYDVFVFVLRK